MHVHVLGEERTDEREGRALKPYGAVVCTKQQQRSRDIIIVATERRQILYHGYGHICDQ